MMEESIYKPFDSTNPYKDSRTMEEEKTRNRPYSCEISNKNTSNCPEALQRKVFTRY